MTGTKDEALIRLRGITRAYRTGETETVVLHGVDLDICRGEFVAIIGSSGSGKSTLMNIIGCLDKATTGDYSYDGRPVAEMDAEDLSALRRRHFGFIFQRYQLLGDLDARQNVEVPAAYQGADHGKRKGRAEALLKRLGLGERMAHRPSELSGGQQQRVSVARALMNGGEVILADEPTGALDSASGLELLALLRELNGQGHTVIIVTHDPKVAEAAGRVIEISDGKILSDTTRDLPEVAPSTAAELPPPAPVSLSPALSRFRDSFYSALLSLSRHRLRSFLTMLGIIIGIASVVSVVALGTGSQQQVLERISAIGTNTITVRAGTGFGDRRSDAIDTLVPADATALAAEDFATSASAVLTTTARLSRDAVSSTASVYGVGADYFDVSAYTLTEGRLFTEAENDRRAQVVVIDDNAVDTYFDDGTDPIGETMLVDKVPLRVIGVVESSSTMGPPDQVRIFSPLQTVAVRITGDDRLSSISVRVADDIDMDEAEAGVEALMLERHGVVDFSLQNSDTIREAITSTTQTMTYLISAIAVISLVVGGIGVMNIMLVSVTERTGEIGVRIAVGARRSDIVTQFLLEAVMLCLLGGLLGILGALGVGWAMATFQSTFTLVFSSTTIWLAFLTSTLIGLGFGYLPARSASRLDPVEALARD